MNKWRGNPWAILLTLSLGFFMTLLDLTIVNIAIPDMIDKLGASFDEVLWVLNAYILVLAVLLITCGRLGDIRGKKEIFIGGVAIFTLASLACGLSQDPAQLIAARAIQGLGAAMLMPQTMSIIIETFPSERRGAALGIWGAVAGLSTIAGPTVGGLLISIADWRWIFFVNVPIGALVLFMAVPILPTTQRRRHRFDVPGVLVVSAALFCLAFGLTEGQRYEWNGWIWTLLGASLVLMLVFLQYQRTQQANEPLVPFELFKDRNFSVMNFVGSAVSVGMIGMMVPMTIYLQSVQGYSALKASLIMAPASVVSMFLAPLAGRLSDRVGGKFLLMAGLTTYAVGTMWLLLIADTGTHWAGFMGPFTVCGIGIGFVFAPMATEATRNVPMHLAGAASGVNNTTRQIGSVLGTAAVGAILQNQLASSLQDEATKRSAALPADFRGQFVDGFKTAAKGGLEVSGNQSGPKLPSGVPADVANRIRETAAQVFGHGFVHALKPTMALPVVVILLGSAACFGLKGHAPTAEDAAPQPTEPAVQS